MPAGMTTLSMATNGGLAERLTRAARSQSSWARQTPQLQRTSSSSSANACRDGEEYIVNGHKWWTSGAPDPRCKISIFMGKTDASAATHKQQSMILVPMDAPGVDILRPLNVYGYDDAPHGHAEVMYKVTLCNPLLVCGHAESPCGHAEARCEMAFCNPLHVYGYDDAPHGHAEVMYKVTFCSPCMCVAIMMCHGHAEVSQ